MRGAALSPWLIASLVPGCDLTSVNPAACKLKDPNFCGAGTYCDQTLNACLPTCNDDKFCMVVPASQASDLHGIYGSSTTDIWAVGNAGTTLHWNGTDWQSVPSNTGVDLHGVWGNAANNFYAVGDGGLILHWNGASWAQQPSGVQVRLNALSGFRNLVWAVGDSGTILYSMDGTTWQQKSNPRTNNLYGAWNPNSNQSQAFSVGGGSDILLCDVNSPMASAQSNTGDAGLALYAVHGYTQSAFWAVGQAGQITQGSTASFMPLTPVTSADLFGIWLVLINGNTRSGWIVGDGGTILSTDNSGLKWIPRNSPTTAPLYAVWSSSIEDSGLWSVGAGGIILHWPGLPN